MNQEQLKTSALENWFPVAPQDWLWLHLSGEQFERRPLIHLEMPLTGWTGSAGHLSK